MIRGARGSPPGSPPGPSPELDLTSGCLDVQSVRRERHLVDAWSCADHRPNRHICIGVDTHGERSGALFSDRIAPCHSAFAFATTDLTYQEFKKSLTSTANSL